MNNKLLLFTHIPKTAGTSFRQIVMNQSGRDRGFLCYPGLFNNQTTNERLSLLKETLLKEDTDKNIRSPNSIKAIAGHVGYGIHAILPARFYQYITFLREPVARILSYYFHLHRLGKIGTPSGDQSEYIQKYINDKFLIEIDNLQTRYVSGKAWQHIVLGNSENKIGFGECQWELLKLAKENLANNYLFGLQSEFSASLKLFENKLGWNLSNNAFKTSLNKKGCQNISDIDPTVIKSIKKLNWLDLELYEYAKELFTKQIKTIDKVQDDKMTSQQVPKNKPGMLALRQQVARHYLFGHGIEIGALHRPLKVSQGVEVSYVDRMSRQELKQHYPELSKYDLVNVDIVDNGEDLNSIENNSFDFVIANQMLEHCQNPIQTIKNHLRVLKPQGILYLTLPDKRHTFDRNRPLTHITHLVEDYTKGAEGSFYSHMYEWAKFIDRVPDNQISSAVQKLVAANRNIHFHVFTLESFMELVVWCKSVAKFPIKVELVQSNDREFIVVIRKVVAK